ncbi:hypothetical protein HDU91_001896, partial [Kappamyces sp. JEL0680]
LTRVLIETQLKKMEIKLQHFQEMESLLDSERRDLEADRHAFYLERLAFKNGEEATQGGAVAVEVSDVPMDSTASILALQ